MASCSFSFSRAHRKLCFLLLLSADRHSHRLLPVLSTATSTDFRIRCWVSTNCRSGFTTSSLSAVANALHKDLTLMGFYLTIIIIHECTFEIWCLRLQLCGSDVFYMYITVFPSLSSIGHTEAIKQYPLIRSMLWLWFTLTLSVFSTPSPKAGYNAFFSSLLLHQAWDSVVSIETHYRIDGSGFEAGGVKGFFCSPNSIQTRHCTCRPIHIKGISWQCSTQNSNRIDSGPWFLDSDTV